MSSWLANPRNIHHTNRKPACVLKPMRLLRYSGELKEKDPSWNDGFFLSPQRINIFNNNYNNNITHRSKTMNQTASDTDGSILNITSTNNGNSSNIEIETKESLTKPKSAHTRNIFSKEESIVLCSINNKTKPEEFRREYLSNSKYFNPTYLQEAAQKMATYLKTFLKPDESQKENRPLNCSGSFHGSQKISENSKAEPSNNIANSCKRILRKPLADVTPLDPQVERLTCFIDCFPSIYVSQSGMINIFLRQGVLLEVTVDKAIRLVDQNQDMAAAVSGRSKACSVHHRSVKICQNKSAVDIDLGAIWQAKIRTGHIMVGDRRRTIWFDEAGNFGTSEYSKHQFVAASLTDYTVDLLLSSASYGPALVPICKKLVSAAKFECTRIGSVSVHVNDVTVIQKSPGDVIVMAGSKLLKMRPRAQSVEIHTGSTDIAVSPEWGITCQLRKSLSLTCSSQQLTVSNGSIESRLHRDGQIELRKVSDGIA